MEQDNTPLVEEISTEEFDEAYLKRHGNWPFKDLEVGQSLRMKLPNDPTRYMKVVAAIKNHGRIHGKKFQRLRVKGYVMIKRIA